MVDNELENWVDWMKRATRASEECMSQFGVPDWVEEVHRRKFRWAGHVSRRHDGRWTREVLTWSASGSRTQGRPKLRWTDGLNSFFNRSMGLATNTGAGNMLWMAVAEDRERWQAVEDEYIKAVL